MTVATTTCADYFVKILAMPLFVSSCGFLAPNKGPSHKEMLLLNIRSIT
jgi:hypothetical protein